MQNNARRSARINLIRLTAHRPAAMSLSKPIAPPLRVLPYRLQDSSSQRVTSRASDNGDVRLVPSASALQELASRGSLVRERNCNSKVPPRVKIVSASSEFMCDESTRARHIGHPFLDALRFANERQCSFVLNPHVLWTLISEALAGYFRNMPTLYAMIEARRGETSDFADQRPRFFIDTPSEEIANDPLGAFHASHSHPLQCREHSCACPA